MVLHVIVAEEVVMLLTLTFETIGADSRVVKVEFDELAELPLELAEVTTKLYSVPEFRPVRVTV